MTESKMEVIEEAYTKIESRDPNQTEFLRSVKEVFDCLIPLIDKYPKYSRVLNAIAEPERIIKFRVA